MWLSWNWRVFCWWVKRGCLIYGSCLPSITSWSGTVWWVQLSHFLTERWKRRLAFGLFRTSRFLGSWTTSRWIWTRWRKTTGGRTSTFRATTAASTLSSFTMSTWFAPLFFLSSFFRSLTRCCFNGRPVFHIQKINVEVRPLAILRQALKWRTSFGMIRIDTQAFLVKLNCRI